MNDFDDFRPIGADDPPADDKFSAASSRAPWLVTIFFVAVAAVFVYLFFFRDRRIVVPPPAPTVSRQEAAPKPAAPVAVNPADVGLPPLDQSDDTVRGLARGLSTHPELAAWLATRDLIRGFAVMIDNVADGKVPTAHLRLFAPKEKFGVSGRDAHLVMDERNYHRFDGLASAIASLDTAGSAATYERLKPLIVVAYRDLGHPDGNVDAALHKAIDNLLATPVLEGPVPLTQRAVAYQFANPDLEGLMPAQKQLLRMGPRNMRLIQGKLRQLAEAVGFADSTLPPPVVVRP
ncbi:MAG: DUF3014 domain-containing protein [Acidobacteriota bacterium]|nr:DUF3014 domain-containing protein [Acidobacteriota bacterium]